MLKKVKLITESDIFDYELLKEAEDPSKPVTYKMRGVYIQADVVNGNNRKYRYDMMKKTVDDFIEKKIKTKTALEELEHGDNVALNPDRVCARTLNLEEDNKSWIGTSVILSSDPKFGIIGTPCGDLLKSLLQYDVSIGHSTRGVGNVAESGEVKDYQLICIDTVLSPSIGIFNKSNANRFVEGILESKQFVIDIHGDIYEESYDKLSKGLSKSPNTFITSKKNAHIARAAKDFLESFMKI